MSRPRDRLIRAAIALVRERGVDATGMADLLERGETARRSVYQNFPGGKLELIEASTRAAGDRIKAVLERLAARGDTASVVRTMIEQTRSNLVQHNFELGCPIAAAAMSSPEAVHVRAAAASVFAGWVEQIEALLVREGRPADEARSLAGFVVSSIEGALLCARASRSTEPLDQAEEQLQRLIPCSD